MAIRFCCLLLALTAVLVTAQENTFAPEVLECYTTTKPDDVKFGACLLQFWERNKAKVVAGMPELEVPKLDPMSIPNIVFNEKGTVVDVSATFSAVIVKGVANHQGKSVKIDRNAKTIVMEIHFPHLYVTGNYDVKGTILLTPVNGKGPFTLNMTNIDGVATAHLVNQGGKVAFSKLEVDFTIGTMRLDLLGLLSQDTVGEAVMNMLNDNSQEILTDIKPKVSQQLADAISPVLKGGFFTMDAKNLGL